MDLRSIDVKLVHPSKHDAGRDVIPVEKVTDDKRVQPLNELELSWMELQAPKLHPVRPLFIKAESPIFLRVLGNVKLPNCEHPLKV